MTLKQGGGKKWIDPNTTRLAREAAAQAEIANQSVSAETLAPTTIKNPTETTEKEIPVEKLISNSLDSLEFIAKKIAEIKIPDQLDEEFHNSLIDTYVDYESELTKSFEKIKNLFSEHPLNREEKWRLLDTLRQTKNEVVGIALKLELDMAEQENILNINRFINAEQNKNKPQAPTNIPAPEPEPTPPTVTASPAPIVEPGVANPKPDNINNEKLSREDQSTIDRWYSEVAKDPNIKLQRTPKKSKPRNKTEKIDYTETGKLNEQASELEEHYSDNPIENINIDNPAEASVGLNNPELVEKLHSPEALELDHKLDSLRIEFDSIKTTANNLKLLENIYGQLTTVDEQITLSALDSGEKGLLDNKLFPLLMDITISIKENAPAEIPMPIEDPETTSALPPESESENRLKETERLLQELEDWKKIVLGPGEYPPIVHEYFDGKDYSLGENDPQIVEAFDRLPAPTQEKIAVGLFYSGFKLKKLKSDIMASLFEKNDAPKTPSELQAGSTFSRLKHFMAESYRDDSRRAKAEMREIAQLKEQGDSTRLRHKIGTVSNTLGFMIKSGRVIADVTGISTVNPLRYVLAGSMAIGRLAGAGKESTLAGQKAQKRSGSILKNPEAKETAAEFKTLHEFEAEAFASLKERFSVDKNENSDDVKKRANRLKEIRAKVRQRFGSDKGALNKARLFVHDSFQALIQADNRRLVQTIDDKLEAIEANQKLAPEKKAIKRQAILRKYSRHIKDLDRMTTKYAHVDTLAYGASRLEGVAGMTTKAMMLESLLMLSYNFMDEIFDKNVDLDQESGDSAQPEINSENPAPATTASDFTPVEYVEATETPTITTDQEYVSPDAIAEAPLNLRENIPAENVFAQGPVKFPPPVEPKEWKVPKFTPEADSLNPIKPPYRLPDTPEIETRPDLSLLEKTGAKVDFMDGTGQIRVEYDISRGGDFATLDQTLRRLVMQEYNFDPTDKVLGTIEAAQLENTLANVREIFEGKTIAGISPSQLDTVAKFENGKLIITDYEKFSSTILKPLFARAAENITSDSPAVKFAQATSTANWQEMLDQRFDPDQMKVAEDFGSKIIGNQLEIEPTPATAPLDNMIAENEIKMSAEGPEPLIPQTPAGGHDAQFNRYSSDRMSTQLSDRFNVPKLKADQLVELGVSGRISGVNPDGSIVASGSFDRLTKLFAGEKFATLFDQTGKIDKSQIEIFTSLDKQNVAPEVIKQAMDFTDRIGWEPNKELALAQALAFPNETKYWQSAFGADLVPDRPRVFQITKSGDLLLKEISGLKGSLNIDPTNQKIMLTRLFSADDQPLTEQGYFFSFKNQSFAKALEGARAVIKKAKS
ncbi:MAG: hypothetical protein A2571_01055 [Candidatus Vogelbacteria bacterium RIFOXYD1_FULL_44_32]|uniref:Uncharacterized protein n=1 Tax=Candidatus Vogelbacteria bacterium RIFOXYD1_FULL_44_32 TaxID=1802438 RepID=A0A1G2QEN9_9BACT|nr:MAG: hypothetical protein A2571_01055 [Candidatus Vogelbacteria bacterium RIFOXYD1_FULL_44_32]